MVSLVECMNFQVRHTFGSLNTLGVLKAASVVARELVVLSNLEPARCDVNPRLADALEVTCTLDRHAMASPAQLLRAAAIVIFVMMIVQLTDFHVGSLMKKNNVPYCRLSRTISKPDYHWILD